MTLSTLSVVVTRDGTGATDSFSFPFTIQDNTQIEVTHIDADGVETSIIEGTAASEYSLNVTSFPGNGSITYPADSSFFIPSTEKIRIRRTLDLTQPTRLRIQGGYDPRVQESVYDRLTMITQQIQEEVDRCAILPETGFDGLAGASPIVNATEDGFDWAVGFQGPAGTDGEPGTAGPAGPWKFLASYDLTGLGSLEITDFANNTNIVAVQIRLQNVTATADNTECNIQVTKNSSLKTNNYNFSGNYSDHAGGHAGFNGANVGSIAATLRATSSEALSNAANENLDCVITIEQPSEARAHHVKVNSAWTSAASTESQIDLTGQFTGTDIASALDSITILTNSSTFATGDVLVFGLLAHDPELINSITTFKPGAPSASEVILREVVTDAANIAADYALSQLSAGVAATESTIFNVAVNGAAAGTITVGAAETTGTFDNSGAGVALVAGDVITVTAPASPDATLADISVNIRSILDLT